MSLYMNILDILEKKGPASIPSICQEMNQLPNYLSDNEKQIQPKQIKSAIAKKKELFKLEDNLVSIVPEKEIQIVTVNIGRIPGPSITVKVDFQKRKFMIFEWLMDSRTLPLNKLQTEFISGNIEEFKKELYQCRIWEWQADYQGEGIILDGIIWSLKLITKGKIYHSEGMQQFPNEWPKLYRGLAKLTGIKL